MKIIKQISELIYPLTVPSGSGADFFYFIVLYCDRNEIKRQNSVSLCISRGKKTIVSNNKKKQSTQSQHCSGSHEFKWAV